MESDLDRTLFGLSGKRFLAAAVFLVSLLLFPASAVADSDVAIRATMGVDRTEASPGDIVTFRISVDAPKPGGDDLLVRDTLPDGLALVSASASGSCQPSDGGWVCRREGVETLVIEIRAGVQPGTEGQELVNIARIEPQGDDEGGGITVQASVRVLPPGAPFLEVDVRALQVEIVPDYEVNYRIQVTNSGTAAAPNLSIVAFVPADMTLVSAYPWPAASVGELRWVVESLPVGSFDFLFNTTLPSRSPLTEVSVEVAVAYGEGPGEVVEIRALPSTLEVVPRAPATPSPSSPGFLIGGLGVIAVAVLSLLVAQRVVGFPTMAGARAEEVFLLHRSGVVLNHFSLHPRDADSDIVGGMMAAVRMFVEDSISPLAGPLREIRFGRGSILFVTGDHVTLAAVNARGNGARFADRATRYLREFERLNEEALANFDGVAGGLEGIDAAFQKLSGRPAQRDLPTSPDLEDVPRQ